MKDFGKDYDPASSEYAERKEAFEASLKAVEAGLWGKGFGV